MPDDRPSLKYLTWFTLIAGTIILVAGAILLFVSPIEKGLAVVAVGLGFIAVAYAGRAEIILHEIRRSEIDEKMAVVSLTLGNPCQRIISDLRAIEEISGSSTKSQAEKLAADGRLLVASMKTSCPNQVQEAQDTLNRILRRHKLSV